MLVGSRYLHPKTLQSLTLRYIGPLPPSFIEDPSAEKQGGSSTKSTWLGVEYDDPSKGRGHSGTFEGIQVFTTRQPGAGAFIKATNKHGQPPLTKGKTFVQSIEERYGALVTPSTDSSLANDDGSAVHDTTETIEKVVLGSSGSAIIVEAPGLEAVRRRIGRLERLRDVGLDGEWVSEVGGDDVTRSVLRARMGGVKTLDLSRNLLSSWVDISKIAECLPGLETLVLNYSRISPISGDDDDQILALQEAFDGIRELHLGNSLVSLEEYTSVGRLFPNLESLYLNDNPTIDFPKSIKTSNATAIFTKLRVLGLDNSQLTSWERVVEGPGRLPRLEDLKLSSDGIQVIPPPPVEFDLANIFSDLRSLSLNDTPLGQWTDIDHLETWTQGRLQHLRFTTPYEQDPVEGQLDGLKKSTTPIDAFRISNAPIAIRRSIIIAKLSSLIFLNSTRITSAERRDAELFYISYVAKIVSPSHPLANDIPAMSWGRYETLCETYGKPVTAPQNSEKTTGLRSKLITLHIYPANREIPPIPLQILPSSPISLLRKKIARVIDVPASDKIRMWTVRSTGETAKEEDEWPGKERVSEIEDGEGRDVGWWLGHGDEVGVSG